jgi:hypothetical protein
MPWLPVNLCSASISLLPECLRRFLRNVGVRREGRERQYEAVKSMSGVRYVLLSRRESRESHDAGPGLPLLPIHGAGECSRQKLVVQWDEGDTTSQSSRVCSAAKQIATPPAMLTNDGIGHGSPLRQMS